MTTYTRTHDGHTTTVHAPPVGAFDQAARDAFEAFTGAEPVLGLDVETSAIEDRGARQFATGFTVRLVQFGTTTDAWVLDPTDPAQRQAIETTLSDPARRFVTHTPYDVLAVWAVFEIALGQRVIDAHLLSKLIDPDERAGHGLKDLTARHLDNGLTTARDALYGRMRALAPVGHRAGDTWKTWGWNHLPATDESYVVYAGLDAVYVRRLLPVLLEACGPFAHLVPVEAWLAAQAVGITIRGLLLDRPYALTLLTDLQAEHHQADTRIKDTIGCPGGSPRFAAWLDDQTTQAGITGLPRTDTGRLQVTTDTLTALLNHHTDQLPAAVVELAGARLAMARTSNLIGNLKAFLNAADDEGRVHPQINTLRAKTARMSITGPALQTLKKHDPRLRRCYRADPGHVLISSDFSQVEVRVAAALSSDPTLTRVITSGVKIHDATAALMYGDGFTPEQRDISKRCTFGTLYGGGAKALAAQTGVTEQVARQVTARWRNTYPDVIAYTKSLEALATVVTASGRHILADRARPYANGNYMIQSTARDLLLAAVYRLVTRYQITGLWLFVHDEVIVQAPEADAERVRDALHDAMTSAFRGVPILADAKILGTHWGELPAAPAVEPVPARPPQIAGTAGAPGIPAGQPAVSRFRAGEEVPELPELPESTPRRVLLTGSRTWTDENAIADPLREQYQTGAVLVTGACPRGADAIAERLWTAWGGHVERHPAYWDNRGRGAGPERNAAMVATGADVCLAFIRDHSPGATRTADLAERAGIPTTRYPHRLAVVASRPPHPLAIALACARRGWRVFPIRPRSKKPPAIHDWETHASLDPDQIRRYGGWRDGTHNVGIATGPSGLVVLDLDPPKPGQTPPTEWARPGIGSGEDVLADLCETHREPYPSGTFTVRTGRGGAHLYFTLPAGSNLRNSNGDAGRGLGWLIDVRAGGGYVVAPGCVVDLDDRAGTYTVTDASNPRPLPEWLTGLLKPAHDPAAPLECIPPVVGRVSDLDAYVKAALKGESERVRTARTGGRNHALNKAAYNLGRLIAAGALPEPLATTELYAAASAHFASDPPLTADDARATIGAGIAAGKRSPRQVHGREAA